MDNHVASILQCLAHIERAEQCLVRSRQHLVGDTRMRLRQEAAEWARKAQQHAENAVRAQRARGAAGGTKNAKLRRSTSQSGR
jgi:hypothetical protein